MPLDHSNARRRAGLARAAPHAEDPSRHRMGLPSSRCGAYLPCFPVFACCRTTIPPGWGVGSVPGLVGSRCRPRLLTLPIYIYLRPRQSRFPAREGESASLTARPDWHKPPAGMIQADRTRCPSALDATVWRVDTLAQATSRQGFEGGAGPRLFSRDSTGLYQARGLPAAHT
jgi:hypothetical protein